MPSLDEPDKRTDVGEKDNTRCEERSTNSECVDCAVKGVVLSESVCCESVRATTLPLFSQVMALRVTHT